ncbi:MAG: cytochrome b/b6 domain-containing protein [Sulfurimonas sp.]|nr:cytochrome b/b6 domain-containing protein [Sulfurimonas sp.]
MTKVYVWSLATRFFHILLVLAVGLAYILSEVENFLSFHVALGYMVGLLLLYRIVWGFMDVRYSKFKDFNLNLRDLFAYMINVFGEKKEYVGHNPASSWAIVSMIVLALLAVVSGTLVYGTQEGMGVLSFLNATIFKDMELFEEIHEFFANALIAVVFVHIAGVVLDKVVHKSDAISSMKNGYKNVDAKSVELSLFQRVFGFIWIGSSVLFFVYMLVSPSNIMLEDANKRVDYKVKHELFYEECISCHTLYPPYLLPKESWITMMNDLENHFGDDASLEEEDKELIQEYLVKNAAENSTKESAYKILNSIDKKGIIAITKTKYWKKRHDDIDDEVFKNKNISKKSNCKACHKGIEQGLLNDKDIKIPK